ncbi:hypothetical protein KGQ55_01240 [Patescibacteria group bacterium]|nr:hypothetical protein [Patescibacteria group bacterium]
MTAAKPIAAIVAACALALPAAAAAAGNYVPSNLGYDLSYNASSYPVDAFNFGIIGITGGKAFVHNERLISEYAWARFGSVAPTVYMNLNAPFGSTVAGHVSAPKTCPASATDAAASTTKPTACEAYDYGYNAAADAFAYARSAHVSSSLWWLDIEEANSWAEASSTNDATIQGAIDYLNAKQVRAGIYSTPRMWKAIAGSDFVPRQTLRGTDAPVPVWLPIGIASQVAAMNACVTQSAFIPGSPVWLVQFEASSTSVDRNNAC